MAGVLLEHSEVRLQACAYAGTSERLTKQVKGLLNRLAEANLQSTVVQAAELLQSEGRRLVVQCLTNELLQVDFMSCAPWAVTHLITSMPDLLRHTCGIMLVDQANAWKVRQLVRKRGLPIVIHTLLTGVD